MAAKDQSAPALTSREFGRWVWRQLTSMRTALLLLLLLALAAIPGSLIPQRSVDRSAVERVYQSNPDLARIYDNLGLFSVYTSVWFSAIYLLLMASLIGCIIPRVGVYWRALRARPPKAPRNFDRLPASRTYETGATPDEVLQSARTALRRSRVDVVGDEVRAESGYLREAGNLVFHICLVIVLIGVAAGALYGYRGHAIVTEGDGFSNTLTQYDEFSSGALFDDADLPPFSLELDDFTAEFELDGPSRGAPRLFRADGTYRSEPGAAEQPYSIEVNHPLDIDGTSVFIVGQGYAPVIRVRDGNGAVAFEGPVPFLPQDSTYTSTGVVKAPDAEPDPLGFQGLFLPTAVEVEEEAPMSIFPGPGNPTLGLFAYYGDLGMDAGDPQSVYILDKTDLTRIQDDEGKPLRITLSLRQITDLPEGRGSVEFLELRKFARFQFSNTPGLAVPLWGTSIGLLGLILSLSIRPRRTWVRVRRTDGAGSRTVVEVASLERVSRGDLVDDLDVLLERIQLGAPAAAPPEPVTVPDQTVTNDQEDDRA